VNVSRRGLARGAKRLDMSGVRAALADRRYWLGIGLVYEPSGEPHYEVDEDLGVLVNVELMPEREPLLCRLGGLGQGGAYGVWRIPPVGSEVAVAVPGGDIGGDTIIVGVLASGGVPDELDEETLVVKAPKVVIIADGAVEVGEAGLVSTDGVVHGTGIDPFTGATYAALGSTSAKLRAKK
jgi:hypothetical protein